MPNNDRWIADPRSGGRLVIPADQIEALQKAALARQDETRKRFMSDQGASKGEGKGTQSFDTEIAIDQPMRGDLLSWAQSYAPWESIGGRRKPTDTVPFGFLRQIARQSFLDRVILDKRISQMKHFARFVDYAGDKQPGFRVVHRRHGDPTFVETPEIMTRCAEVQARLANVTPEIHNGFRDFVTGLVEDELVLDRKVCVVYRDMQGRPAQWHAIDGSSVKPRLQVLLPWMYQNATDNQALAAEIMSYDKKLNPRSIDLTNAAYVQEVEGRFVAAWTAEQMTIDTTNPSTRINSFGYGQSLLEKSLEGTRAWVLAWNYNIEIFKTNYPEAILALLGDYDPMGLEAFKRQVLGEVGEQRNWRLSIVPGGPPDQFKAEVIKLRDTPKDMLFGEMLRMLIALKCAAFQMHPSEVNFSADMGSQETIFAKGSTEKEVSRATEEGLHTMLDNWCDWITRAFIQQNYDDLKLIVEGLDRPDESTLAELADTASKSVMLVDEARQKFYNLPPLEGGMGEYIDSPTFAAQQQMVMQAEAAEQQQGAYEEGDFGEDGEGGPGEEGPAGEKSPFGGNAKGGKDKGGSPFGGKGKGDKQDSGSAEGSDSADAPGGQWDEQGPTGAVERPKAKPKDKKKPAKPGQHHPEGAPADKKKYTNKEAHGKPSEHHMRTEEGPPSKKRGEQDDEEVGKRDDGGDRKESRDGKGSDKSGARPRGKEDEKESGDEKERDAKRGRGTRGGDEGSEGSDRGGDERDAGEGADSDSDELTDIVELIKKDPSMLKKLLAALGAEDEGE
jgi:hypothetical protein